MEDSVNASTAPTEAEPDLPSLKKMFEDSATLTKTARTDAETSRDYFDGTQWTQDEKNKLATRKQPDNVFNRIRPAIEGVLGVIDQGQTDPKAWPRNPQDEDAAEVATKTLRYIEDRSRFDRTKMDCAEQFFVEGTCAVVCEVDERKDIQPTHIRFEEFFYDPRSRRKDFKDARYMGVAKWRYSDEVAAEYPDAKDDIETTLSGAAMGDITFQDRPQDGSTTVSWVDRTKRRVMVVELYYQEAKTWRRACFWSGGVLDSGVSAYLDTYKQPKCPIEAASCYIDRGNNRYGKVRDMIGPQDEINKRRSKLLHLVTVSQIQAVDPSAVEVDEEKARKEAARPDGVIPFGWQKVPTTDMAAGQSNLLAEAKSEIERMGPNPAILGRQGENQSGRANLVRQQAGMTELAPTMGVFDDFVLRVYRAMWEAAQQFWTAPMFIRTTDDDGAPQFIGINQPQHGQPQVVLGENGVPTLQPTVLGYENQVAEMDVDITIETTPDTANVAQEQFMALVELTKSGVHIPPEILIECSSLPEKRKILDKLKAAGAQPDPAKNMALAATNAKIALDTANAHLAVAKTETELMKPHVDALQAVASLQPPPPPGAPQGATGAPQFGA